MTRPGRVLIGTSGYVYRDWRLRFYPKTTVAREWLPYYAARFPTVELNNPFYRLPSPSMFRAWRANVPAGFVFAVKASRYLTHVKRLKEPEPPLRLLLSRARRLGPTLGPVLFQLPPRFHVDIDRLDRFLRALGRQRLVRPLRAVLEVREASWLDPDVFDRLRAAGVALCLADWRDLPIREPLTADFVYVRRHGYGRRGSYTARALGADARAIERWRTGGRDVYVYFNNDWKAFAIRNALALTRLVGGTERRTATGALASVG